MRSLDALNLDLSRMILAGKRDRQVSNQGICKALDISEDHLRVVEEHPVRVPLCDFAAVVSYLHLVDRYYEVYLANLVQTSAAPLDSPDSSV